MFDRIKTFLDEPLGENMTAFDWFLFVGLILAVLTAWRIIINQIAA